MREFAHIVKELNKHLHPDSHNTFTVASLMYPPRLAWFPDNGREPPGYVNMMEKIDWLNHKIRELNIANNFPHFPGFRTLGVRKVTRRWKDMFGQEHHREMQSHRWEQWVGSSRSEKLKLSQEKTFTVGSAINHYFITRT